VQARILAAATFEFAEHSFSGARIDRISKRAKTVDRMLYYYFGNKKDVYLAVIEQCYSDIRASEQQLALDTLPPREALRALAVQSFHYHENNRNFTRLVLQENFQGGEMLRQVPTMDALRQAALEPLQRILDRGQQSGIFRAGLEAADVHYLISALSGFRVDHASTWAGLLQIDLLSDPIRSRHLQLLLDQLDAMVALQP